ncbi:hypothetical protein VTK56DRAFT_6735 [Thermocarpiscus australiensis]
MANPVSNNKATRQLDHQLRKIWSVTKYKQSKQATSPLTAAEALNSQPPTTPPPHELEHSAGANTRGITSMGPALEPSPTITGSSRQTGIHCYEEHTDFAVMPAPPKRLRASDGLANTERSLERKRPRLVEDSTDTAATLVSAYGDRSGAATMELTEIARKAWFLAKGKLTEEVTDTLQRNCCLTDLSILTAKIFTTMSPIIEECFKKALRDFEQDILQHSRARSTASSPPPYPLDDSTRSNPPL